MSIAAYKTTIRESETPRQIERRVLAGVTGRLSERAEAFDRADDLITRSTLLGGGLREDLALNQKIWTELKHDLVQPGNALPAELRAGLISLALWVDRQTVTVLGGKPGIAALIDINRSIIAGLAGQAPSAAEVA
ncbi:flagellar biosynthesis regulator FlaF [Limimaricola variabilis]|jgi:flagellar protein FlaF|uniref:flagellar biosynthesis regulator FlaF n=1 Tax=Limimaricola variabilis TaxID=1492771 RepID=UPI002AC98883|nr:flagellar biosynthesis regulator FlaF [Limimaricola variabilis]WPY94913.1 flagellar biosynthesis regulator FlaF [Limimaricola variabilis]